MLLAILFAFKTKTLLFVYVWFIGIFYDLLWLNSPKVVLLTVVVLTCLITSFRDDLVLGAEIWFV